MDQDIILEDTCSHHLTAFSILQPITLCAERLPDLAALFWQFFPLSVLGPSERINGHARRSGARWEPVTADEFVRWLGLFSLSVEHTHGSSDMFGPLIRFCFFPAQTSLGLLLFLSVYLFAILGYPVGTP